MGNLKWPEGKKCAVMFTFDVDGDTTWENGNRGDQREPFAIARVAEHRRFRGVHPGIVRLHTAGVKNQLFQFFAIH